MSALKRIYFFIKNDIKQFKRKFLLLPLILFLPFLIIGIIIFSIIFLIQPDEQAPMKVGLVDYDQSMETEAVVQSIEESSQLTSFIKIENMSEEKAKQMLSKDDLVAYIVFPSQFTNDLYIGHSVTIEIIGNEKRTIESYLIKELLDSVVRHIETSQASILMVNEQAKAFGMEDSLRQEMIFELFTESFLNVLSKDSVISEEVVTNYATTKTIEYYSVSLIFIIIVIWLLMIFNMLYNQSSKRLINRMRLYGVTHYEKIIARLIVTLFMVAIFSIILWVIINSFINFHLATENIVRLILVLLFHSLIFLQMLALLEMVINSERFRLLSQLSLTIIFIFISGAVIPTIYLPLFLQKLIVYLPPTHSFHWLQELILNERFYVDVKLLIVYIVVGFIILGCISHIKERVTD